MRLPEYKHDYPKYAISTGSAEKLIELYNEMINTHIGQFPFNQEKCTSCVIGNGVRAGLFDDNPPVAFYDNGEFEVAVRSFHLPQVIDDYLFMSGDRVMEAACTLNLPTCVTGVSSDPEYMFGPLDACVRIAAALERSGYDISSLPDIPTS